MGAGVGFMQARMARAWTGRIEPWLWTSIIGMGIPFVFWDIVSVMVNMTKNPLARRGDS